MRVFTSVLRSCGCHAEDKPDRCLFKLITGIISAGKKKTNAFFFFACFVPESRASADCNLNIILIK